MGDSNQDSMKLQNPYSRSHQVGANCEVGVLVY